MALRPRLAPNLEAASSKETALSRYAGMLAILENEPFEAPALDRAPEASPRERRLGDQGDGVALAHRRLPRRAQQRGLPLLHRPHADVGSLVRARARRAGARARGASPSAGSARSPSSRRSRRSRASRSSAPITRSPRSSRSRRSRPCTLGHPLIEADKRVSNDVTIQGPGYALVVTGSNMSGKSTLLRAARHQRRARERRRAGVREVDARRPPRSSRRACASPTRSTRARAASTPS